MLSGRARLRVPIVLGTLLAALLPAGAETRREATQVFLSGSGDQVVRRSIAVVDRFDGQDLDFSWFPERPGTTAAGLLNGSGRLVWRRAGAAEYDRTAVFATYEGQMRDGRPDGRGRLRFADGAVQEGLFRDGRLHGEGTSIEAGGERYDGSFRDGLRHGRGVLRFANGNRHEGAFADGLRHGEGTMILAGGGRYGGRWQDDRFLGTVPDTLADALAGGVTSIAGKSGDADRVEFGMDVDRRLTEQEEAVRYTSEPTDTGVVVRPSNPGLWERWTGQRTIRIEPYWIDYDTDVNYFESHVWLTGDIAAKDGKPFTLKDIVVDVKSSGVFRKPLFSIDGAFGCTSFRPELNLINNGFGKAYGARLTFAFTNRDGSLRSRSFTRDIGDIDTNASIRLEREIAALGANVGTLAATTYVCNGDKACAGDPAARMPLGELAALAFRSSDLGIVFGPAGRLMDEHVVTRIEGRLDYEWRGDGGSAFKASEPLESFIALGTADRFELLAECGAGFGGSPEAPEHLKVELKERGRDYQMALPVRGRKQAKNYTVRLDLTAPRSSVHDVIVRARFADGTVRSARPLYIKYFRIPEDSVNWGGGAAGPAACTIASYTAC